MDQESPVQKKGKMFLLVVLGFLLLLPWCIRGDIPEQIEQTSLLDITTITSISDRQFLYGLLNNLPHTFQFTISEPTEFSVGILSPKIEEGMYALSAILVRENETRRGVTEVARLEAKEASWEPFWHFTVGQRLHQGATFTQMLEPGTYRFEIHTPNNREKYILLLGSQNHDQPSFPEAIKRLMAFYNFLDTSPFSILLSLYGYLSIISIGALVGIIHLLRRHKKVSVLE